MTRLVVSADLANPVGHALVRVRDAGPVARVTKLQIERPDWAESFLGPNGWQVAAVTLAPLAVMTEGADQVMRFGPAVCAHVESGGYVVSVPELGIKESVYWPEIVPPHGGTSAYFATDDAVVAKPTPPRPPQLPLQEPISSPPPPLPPSASRQQLITPSTEPDAQPYLRRLLPVFAILVLAPGATYTWYRISQTPVGALETNPSAVLAPADPPHSPSSPMPPSTPPASDVGPAQNEPPIIPQLPPLPPAPSLAFVQGKSDRQAFQNWVDNLGDSPAHLGAEFWAKHRSDPHPMQCRAVPESDDWQTGCLAAQRRLAPFDMRRKTEPDYRDGWNSL